MDPLHRELRARLQKMAPRRATEYIAAFELKTHEAFCIVECDVRGKSCQQVADVLYTSVDNIYKLRSRAYRKMLGAGE